jgi:hypothetical protein
VSGYNGAGLPRLPECPATHPVTGIGCVEPEGHDGPHYAMGVIRMQLFGDMLTSGEAAS